MPAKFQIDVEVPDSKFEPCNVSVQGSIEHDNWQSELLRGVVELITMIDQMYGKKFADEALKARK